MKGIVTKSRGKVVCGYCSYSATLAELVDRAFEHKVLPKRKMAVVAWRCPKGHMSFTAIPLAKKATPVVQ